MGEAKEWRAYWNFEYFNKGVKMVEVVECRSEVGGRCGGLKGQWKKLWECEEERKKLYWENEE